MIRISRIEDKLFNILLFASALSILILLAGILYTLIIHSLPAFQHFGFFDFITSSTWDSREGTDIYGAANFITGTLLTSFLALAISIPFSLAITLFNGDLFKEKKISKYPSLFINMASSIPSIVWGVWGFYSLRPLLIYFDIGNQGLGIITASLVLAFMIIPYATALSTSYILKIPASVKEAAFTLGANRMDFTFKIALPFAKKGIIASHLLALGRALGEAIIVTILIGNSVTLSNNLFGTGSTMTSIVVNQFGENNSLKFSALMAILLILFLFTAFINYIAKQISKKD